MSDTSHLGMGVMIGMLSGNAETVETLKAGIGKTIVSAELAQDVLTLKFEDGTGLKVWDDGQSCCEHRYMVTADRVGDLVGAKLASMVLKDAPVIPCQYDEHEVQFLDVVTDKLTVQFATHNEHNGYYGGFHVVVRPA